MHNSIINSILLYKIEILLYMYKALYKHEIVTCQLTLISCLTNLNLSIKYFIILISNRLFRVRHLFSLCMFHAISFQLFIFLYFLNEFELYLLSNVLDV